MFYVNLNSVDGVVDQMKFDLDNVLTTDKDQVVPNKVTIRQKTGRANRKKSPVLKAADIEFKGKLNGIDVENSLSKMVGLKCTIFASRRLHALVMHCHCFIRFLKMRWRKAPSQL